MCIYIYIYVYVCINMCINIYIYTWLYDDALINELFQSNELDHGTSLSFRQGAWQMPLNIKRPCPSACQLAGSMGGIILLCV